MLSNNQFNCNNIKIHYVKGPDNGPPVVLLHGLSDRWQAYLSLIPLLCPYYTIYALDLRGHGKSYRTENYKIIDYVYDIESFLIELFDKPVSLIGHSIGAAISLCIGAKHPKKCKSISLIEPFIFKDKLDDKVFYNYFNGCLNVCKQFGDINTIYKNIKETGTLAKKRAVDLFQLDKKTMLGKIYNSSNTTTEARESRGGRASIFTIYAPPHKH